MTIQQLQAEIDKARAQGATDETVVKVGTDCDGHRTLVDRDIEGADFSEGVFFLFREV